MSTQTAALLQEGLGGIQVGEQIGQGGFATVYRGYDPHGDIPVAIKVINPELIARSVKLPSGKKVSPKGNGVMSILARALREGRILMRTTHKHIVRVFRVGEVRLSDDPEIPPAVYVVMELMEGGTLLDVMNSGQLWSELEIVDRICELLDALAEVHPKVIHRDIKPENVMLDAGGVVKLVDFGIAHSKGTQTETRTQMGMTLGTLHLMAPEQSGKAATVTPATDLYAIGQLLYMLLARKPIHMAFWLMKRDCAEGRPEWQGMWDGVPDVLRPIIEKATERDPEDRYSEACVMHAALLAVRGDLQVTIPAPPRPVNPTIVAFADDGLPDDIGEGQVLPFTGGSCPALPAEVTTPIEDLSSGGTSLPWDDDEVRPSRKRRSLALALAFLVPVIALGGWLWSTADGNGEVLETDPPPAVLTKASQEFEVSSSAEPVVDPQPELVDAAPVEPEIPEVIELEPEAMVVHKEPAKVSTPKATVTAAPREAEIPEPAPEANPLITVSGDAQRVWLAQGGTFHQLPATLPAGDYHVYAQFPGGERTLARTDWVHVADGAPMRIICMDGVGCAPK